ncbi:MAG: hypothetical protein OEY94_06545 [Alphaproteobacteria bacterium]|nr:hypothetical protein [Alphaproteobacteria bacterium]
MGPQTRQAIEKAEKQGVLREVNNELARKRGEHYKEVASKNPDRRGFLSGWLDRAQSYILPPIPKEKPF